MKRIKVVGLCLVAVLALAAIVASSASAALPEYQICGKASKTAPPKPKYLGHYSNKNCESASFVETGEQKYERVSWEAAKKKKFKGKNLGTPKNILVSPIHCSGPIILGKCEGSLEPGGSKPASEAGSTECLKEKPEGEVSGPKTSHWVTTYKKCKGDGVPCNTTNKGKEEIVTDELGAELVNLSKEGGAKRRVGLLVHGNGPGGRLAQYECPALGINIEVYGTVLAEQQGNLNVAAKKTKDVVGHGPLNLQSDSHVEEAFTEEQSKEFYETAEELEACEKGESPFPAGAHSEAECHLFGVPEFKSTPPEMLLSVISGALKAKAPAVQNGTTENTGEAFLIADN